jgi:hypothetical protein
MHSSFYNGGSITASASFNACSQVLVNLRSGPILWSVYYWAAASGFILMRSGLWVSVMHQQEVWIYRGWNFCVKIIFLLKRKRVYYPCMLNSITWQGDWRGMGLRLDEVFWVKQLVSPQPWGLIRSKTQKNTPAEHGLMCFIESDSMRLGGIAPQQIHIHL